MPYSQYLRVIRKAVTTESVIFSNHARKRMKERGINRLMVLEALTRGTIRRPPEKNVHGALEVELHRYGAGVNYSVVVAVVEGEIIVTVITVY